MLFGQSPSGRSGISGYGESDVSFKAHVDRMALTMSMDLSCSLRAALILLPSCGLVSDVGGTGLLLMLEYCDSDGAC